MAISSAPRGGGALNSAPTTAKRNRAHRAAVEAGRWAFLSPVVRIGATVASLGLARRRAEFLFAPFFCSAVLAPSFLGGQVEIVVFHLILHFE